MLSPTDVSRALETTTGSPASDDDAERRRIPPSGCALTTSRSAAPARATASGSAALRTLSSAATGTPEVGRAASQLGELGHRGAGLLRVLEAERGQGSQRLLGLGRRVQPPLASTRTRPSGPTCSRAAATRATSSASDWPRSATLTLTVRQPGNRASTPATSSGPTAGRVALTATREAPGERAGPQPNSTAAASQAAASSGPYSTKGLNSVQPRGPSTRSASRTSMPRNLVRSGSCTTCASGQQVVERRQRPGGGVVGGRLGGRRHLASLAPRPLGSTTMAAPDSDTRPDDGPRRAHRARAEAARRCFDEARRRRRVRRRPGAQLAAGRRRARARRGPARARRRRDRPARGPTPSRRGVDRPRHDARLDRRRRRRPRRRRHAPRPLAGRGRGAAQRPGQPVRVRLAAGRPRPVPLTRRLLGPVVGWRACPTPCPTCSIRAEWREVPGFDGLTDVTYHLDVEGRVARVAIDRPEVRNAFRPRTVDELYRVLDHARQQSRGRRRAAHRQRPEPEGRRLGLLQRRRPAHPRP